MSKTKVVINVHGGVVQSVRSDDKNIEVVIFDTDNMDEYLNRQEIANQWETCKKKYPHEIDQILLDEALEV